MSDLTMLSAGTPTSTNPNVRSAESSVDRDVLLQRLKDVGVLRNTHPNFKHGRIYAGPPQQPTVAWKSTRVSWVYHLLYSVFSHRETTDLSPIRVCAHYPSHAPMHPIRC